MSDYLSIAQAAREKETTRATISKWIKEGKLNVERIADRNVIVKDDKFATLQVEEKAGTFAVRVSRLEAKLTMVLVTIEQLKKEIEKLTGKGDEASN